MGKFVISRRFSSGYYFNLKAGNGQIILSSENYISKEACQNGIRAVKSNSQKAEMYNKLQAGNGYYYFNLKAQNGQIIGTSDMYVSMAARDNGIEAVKANAPDATIEDLTY